MSSLSSDSLATLNQQYDAETAKLHKIADKLLTHPKHLCENLQNYPDEIREAVAKILRAQCDLLIRINRIAPLPYERTSYLK